MLVQIKHSLLNNLKGKHAVESGIITGDILAMAHNGKGQIIALKNAGIKLCVGVNKLSTIKQKLRAHK